MKIIPLSSLILLTGLLFSGCTSTTEQARSTTPEPAPTYTTSFQASDPTNAPDLLAGKAWTLESLEFDGRTIEVPQDANTGLEFRHSGQVNGRAGINAFFGQYSIDRSGNLSWGSNTFATTRMAGPRPLIEFENEFLRALRRSNTVLLENGELVLRGTGVRMKFVNG